MTEPEYRTSGIGMSSDENEMTCLDNTKEWPIGIHTCHFKEENEKSCARTTKKLHGIGGAREYR